MSEYIDVTPFDLKIDEDNDRQLSLFVEFMNSGIKDKCLMIIQSEWEDWKEDVGVE